MMNYKYNELDYAILIYNNGFQTKHIPTELRLLAIYMKTILEYKPKQLREELYKFCSERIPEYNRVKYYKIINKAINQSSKKNACLVKIDKIDIYDYELEYIDSLSINEEGETSIYEYDCKKVIFTLLCQMKLNKAISKIKNGNETSGIYFKGGTKKYNELKKISNIPNKINVNSDIIYTLGKNNIITVLFNGLIKLDFIERINEIKSNESTEDNNIAFSVLKFDTIGLYFDYFNNKNKNIKLCKQCKQPFKKNKNRQEYCSDECFNVHRRIYKANKQKAYRISVDN